MGAKLLAEFMGTCWVVLPRTRVTNETRSMKCS